MKRNYKLIWLESLCNLPEIIENNILKTKINSPDYSNWEDREKAVEDFRKRINEYEKIYEKISVETDGNDLAFIQIFNQGEKMIVRNIRGYVESKILSYLINLHTGNRPIYFLRNGESEFNKMGLIGGDSKLSELGEKYGEILARFMKDESLDFKEKPIIYCSTSTRSIQTAEKLTFLNNYNAKKSLDEINFGITDGMSLEEIKIKLPVEYKIRSNDLLHHRYPRGESYMDVIQRIEPIIFEIERIRSPIIVIGHHGILRCLYGYFAGVPIELIPEVDMPIHTIIKFVPEAYGFYEVRYSVNPLTGDIFKDDKNFVKFPDNLMHIPN